MAILVRRLSGMEVNMTSIQDRLRATGRLPQFAYLIEAADLIDELVEALEFYADSENWHRNSELDGNSSNFTGGPAAAAISSAKGKP